MSGLEEQIRTWRAGFEKDAAFTIEDVDELEAHLRDALADGIEQGLEEHEAFQLAQNRIGGITHLRKDYRKVKPFRIKVFVWLSVVFSALFLVSLGSLIIENLALNIELSPLRSTKSFFDFNIAGKTTIFLVVHTALIFAILLNVGLRSKSDRKNTKASKFLVALLLAQVGIVIAHYFVFVQTGDSGVTHLRFSDINLADFRFWVFSLGTDVLFPTLLVGIGISFIADWKLRYAAMLVYIAVAALFGYMIFSSSLLIRMPFMLLYLIIMVSIFVEGEAFKAIGFWIVGIQIILGSLSQMLVALFFPPATILLSAFLTGTLVKMSLFTFLGYCLVVGISQMKGTNRRGIAIA